MKATRYIVSVARRKDGAVTYADSFWDYRITDMTRAKLYVKKETAQKLADRISKFRTINATVPSHKATVRSVNVVVEFN